MDSNAAGEGNNENNVAFNTYWKLTGGSGVNSRLHSGSGR